jgi:hypothetical protein
MKKVIILFFIISNSLLLYGQSTTIPLVIEKSYQLKDIPSPQDIAWDGSNFWVIDNFTFNLYKLSTDFESIDTSMFLYPRDYRDLAFDGKYLWAVDNTFHQALKVNKDSLRIKKILSLPVNKFIDGIACVDTNIYISWFDGWSSQIARVIPGTNSVSFVSYTEGGWVTGLTYYNNRFYYTWNAELNNKGLVAVNPDPYMTVYYSLPDEIKSPTDVEIVSGNFWVLDFETKRLYKLKEDSTTSNVNKTVIPNESILSQNYPNPFNPSTTINFQIPKEGYVTLKVYDILGREVATLVNENKTAGYYNVTFDASKLSSGVYIYKITANSFIQLKKMLMIK